MTRGDTPKKGRQGGIVDVLNAKTGYSRGGEIGQREYTSKILDGRARGRLSKIFLRARLEQTKKEEEWQAKNLK